MPLARQPPPQPPPGRRAATQSPISHARSRFGTRQEPATFVEVVQPRPGPQPPPDHLRENLESPRHHPTTGVIVCLINPKNAHARPLRQTSSVPAPQMDRRQSYTRLSFLPHSNQPRPFPPDALPEMLQARRVLRGPLLPLPLLPHVRLFGDLLQPCYTVISH